MLKAKLMMDTVVTIEVDTEQPDEVAEAAVRRAFAAFRRVEDACSRFRPDSELMLACRQPGIPVALSPYVFEPLKMALELAEWTNGVFDPAIGKTMEKYGFNRHYLTGDKISSPVAESAAYTDIRLDERNRTMLLLRPAVIDLGAVAKGFAIDLAAAELQSFERFAVNAGGDIFAGGSDPRRNVWRIGIRHPERKDQSIRIVEIANEAVCTSGSYERRSDVTDGISHIVNPRTKLSPEHWVSCSVIAPYAMLADAFSTAAFLHGDDQAATLIEQSGLKGILINPDLRIVSIGGV
ncbi:FAD:protein FMN transferase [Paenibacillus sp. MMO-177]|uniref:FAD:protein FMN transferase n=1 Tax=Paenibacillus sp. MMO-177 TaxID=3081289 RepID=UPI0030184B46